MNQPAPKRNATKTTPQLDGLIESAPDLVDRIFEYLLAEFPQIAGPQVEDKKRQMRAEFAGERVYISARSAEERREIVGKVLAMFNGRNATEVARRLQISRAAVYRILKQAGDGKPSQVCWK